jgi:hypothetical protein
VKIPRQLLRDVITIRDFAGSGSLGPTFGAPRTLRASVQPTTRVIVGPDGRNLQCSAMILIRPEDGPIRPESRVTYPPDAYRVLVCEPMPDRRRPTHYEILAETWIGAAPSSGSGS